MEIYLHVPFCVKKCNYCDFTSFFGNDKIKKSYVNKLLEEIDLKAAKYNAEEVETIYFGGGTPTTLSVASLSTLLNRIKEKFRVKIDAEITIEGNPATFCKSELIALKKAGFNRFSVGVQSFIDRELISLGRASNAAESEKALKEVSETFDNFSLDFMLGLEGQTEESLKYTLSKALSFNPPHLSCYMLMVEDKTALKSMVDRGDYRPSNEDETAKLYNYAVNYLCANGYERYEISNFAKNKAYSRHNLGYWQMKNYLGLGISAHSLIGNRRFFNTSKLSEYLNNCDSELAEETLTNEDYKKEYVMLGLRTAFGISLKEYSKRFSCDFLKEYKDVLTKMQRFLSIDSSSVSIKPQYFAVSNSVIVEFM